MYVQHARVIARPEGFRAPNRQAGTPIPRFLRGWQDPPRGDVATCSGNFAAGIRTVYSARLPACRSPNGR